MSAADLRARWSALLAQIATPAFGPGEYIGQESLVSASEVRELADRAAVDRTARVADLCCGTGGPAVFLAAERGCSLIGIDADPPAPRLAAERATLAGCAERTSFVAGDAVRSPLAPGFDAAMLLETMLGIEEKPSLVHEVHRMLRPGGRFALTLEAGDPVSPAEEATAEGGRIWFTPEAEFRALLSAAGFRVIWARDLTPDHTARTAALADAYEANRDPITRAMGDAYWSSIVAQHRTFAAWMAAGRLRKVALVAVSED